MPESHAARGTRRGRRALVTLGEEVRAARLGAGLSQTRVAIAAALSSSEVSRIEHGQAQWIDILTAARLCAVVGLDLSVRAYPGPSPLRDAAHVRLLELLRRQLGTGLVLRTEVPVGDERDQRAWDAVIYDGSRHCAVELETRLTDAQSLLRRVNLKRRDSGVDVVLLVLNDTNVNRHALRAGRDYLQPAFPLDAATVLGALRSGHVPQAGGIVFLRSPRHPSN